MMDAVKRARLEGRVDTVAKLLDLTLEAAVLIEMKPALSDSLHARREQRMSQAELTAKLDASPH